MRTLLLFLSCALSAQDLIPPLPLARILDRQERLLEVYGLPGNFLTGEPGGKLRAFSDDGTYQWRLDDETLQLETGGRSYRFSIGAGPVHFDGAFVELPLGSWRFNGQALEPAPPLPERRVAGRRILWDAGRLTVRQPDGAEESTPCPLEPADFYAAGADWAATRVGPYAYLLSLRPGRVHLYVVPERSGS